MNLHYLLQDVRAGMDVRGIRREDWPEGWHVRLATTVGESDAVFDGERYNKLYYPTLLDVFADDWVGYA